MELDDLFEKLVQAGEKVSTHAETSAVLNAAATTTVRESSQASEKISQRI